MPNSQILQQPILYVNNLSLQYSTTTALTLGFGQSRDSSNVTDGSNSGTLTLNGANVGVANGTDTALAASTWYYIYALLDSKLNNPIAGLISPSATAPIVPTAGDGTGWDTVRLVGYWLTDSSSHFIKGYTAGNGNVRELYWDANLPTALTTGSPGTATSLTAVDLSVGVPPVDNTPVFLQVDFIPATAGDTVSIAPFGSTATVLPHVTGQVATKYNNGQMEVLSKLGSSKAEVLYINSAGSGATVIWVRGFRYFI